MAGRFIKYLLSFLLLSSFIISIYVIVVVLDEHVHAQFGQTMNIIGRQRLLSQRMVNFSNQLRECEFLSCDEKTKAQLVDRIRAARNLFQQSFAFLMSGKDGDQKLIKLDQDIYDISGIGREEFDQHVKHFLRLVDNIISPDLVMRIRATKELNKFSEHFLTDINLIVKAYVVKTSAEGERLTLLQYLILSLLLTAIPIALIVIFRPLERSLQKSYNDLEEQKNFIQNIIGCLPDPLLIVTADGDALITNKATEKIFGWSEKSLLKMNVSQLLAPDTRAKHGEMIRHFIENPETDASHDMAAAKLVGGVMKSGKEIKISISLARYAGPDGNLGIMVIRDMSLLESLNEALTERIAATRIARESKERFIRNISHELRTPLNAVIGFSELLKTRLKISENRDCVDNIHEGGLKLLEKINQLIAAAAFQSEKKIISISPVNLADYINNMKHIWSEQLEVNNHHLVIGEISSGVAVNMDMDIISYIIKSILDNVVIHCAEGRGVKIYLDSEQNEPCLVIEDNGDGVSADYLSRIGSPFEKKGRKGLRAQKGGLALSLFLATQQMRAMGGEASFHSEAGKGFTVILCLKKLDNL